MLDEFRSTNITWDKATSRIYSPVTANAGDENGRKLVVQIVNGGQVEDLTGATLHLYWETRDKAHDGLDVFDAVDLKKGEFELSYTTGMLSNKGVLNANLVLIDTVGRVVSERFKITVTEGIDNDAIQSENSFSSLTQALIDISNLEQNYAPRLNDLTAQLQQTEQELSSQLAQTTKKTNEMEGKITEFIKPEQVGYNFNKVVSSSPTVTLAFPTIAKFNGKLYIAFRGGATHTTLDGTIRLRVSDDEGLTWKAPTNSEPLKETGLDFRDPQLEVFNGKLVMRAFYRDTTAKRHLIFMFSEDGETWSDYTVVNPPTGWDYAGASGNMLVRDGMLISTAYTYPHPCSVFVVTTTDLINFNVYLSLDASNNTFGDFGASETSIAYIEDRYRIFCRPSPSGQELDWFAARLNSNTFKAEHVEVHEGNLDGPRSLDIDDKRAFLTYRDKTTNSQRILISVVDRNGVQEKEFVLQHERSVDSGYLDLKRHNNYVYGVYYARAPDQIGHDIIYVKYKFNELSNLNKSPIETLKIDSNIYGSNRGSQVAVGYVQFYQDVLNKEVEIVIPVDSKPMYFHGVQLTVRVSDGLNYIAGMKGLTLGENAITIKAQVTNLEQVTNGTLRNLYFTAIYE